MVAAVVIGLIFSVIDVLILLTIFGLIIQELVMKKREDLIKNYLGVESKKK